MAVRYPSIPLVLLVSARLVGYLALRPQLGGGQDRLAGDGRGLANIVCYARSGRACGARALASVCCGSRWLRYRSAAALVLVLPFLLPTMLLMADSLSPSARASGGPPAEASARGAGLGARPL